MFKSQIKEVICLGCKNKACISRNSKGYCSQKCYNESQYLNFIRRWLEGKERGYKGNTGVISNYIRRYMFEVHKNKCQLCGWHEINPVTNKVPLTINHKDGNWKNNNISNLELLCPNCHSLTPNYGSLNKGNGRPRY